MNSAERNSPKPSTLLLSTGCEIIFFPSAYNLSGGEHWDLIFRARAYDNQLFAVVTSPARDYEAKYIAWGHSYVANPFGRIIAQAGISEEILTVELGKFFFIKLLDKMVKCLIIVRRFEID